MTNVGFVWIFWWVEEMIYLQGNKVVGKKGAISIHKTQRLFGWNLVPRPKWMVNKVLRGKGYVLAQTY